jgi:hypothetical protein
LARLKNATMVFFNRPVETAEIMLANTSRTTCAPRRQWFARPMPRNWSVKHVSSMLCFRLPPLRRGGTKEGCCSRARGNCETAKGSGIVRLQIDSHA